MGEDMDSEPTATDLEGTTVATLTLMPSPPQLLPATPVSPPPPPSPLPALPEPLSPLSLEATLPLAATSPTLPELSMSPRGRLMPRLTPTTLTDTTDSATPDTVDTVWATPDMLATLTPASATTTAS